MLQKNLETIEKEPECTNCCFLPVLILDSYVPPNILICCSFVFL